MRKHAGGTVVAAIQAQVNAIVGYREGQGGTRLAQVALPVAHGGSRQYPLPVFVCGYRAVRPEVEAFLEFGTVEKANVGFHKGFIGIEADTHHPHHAGAPADFAYPYCPFLALLTGRLQRIPYRLVSGVAVTDGEVKLDAPCDPRACQPDERRFDRGRLMQALTSRDFIIKRPDSPADLRQHHHAQIGVFQKESAILTRFGFVAQLV
ncbi:hypothetical protein HRbin16_00932 [bacterium HR16]|nr:hypothetical protein HRbin16_00932 [bacterium HR16]